MFHFNFNGVNLNLHLQWEYVIIGCVLFVWSVREFSWYRHWSGLNSTITELNDIRDTLLFRLSIDDATSSCGAESNSDVLNLTTTALLEKLLKKDDIHTSHAIYDLFGLVMILGFSTIIMFENYYLHDVNNEDDSPHKQIIQKVNEFVLKKHPITTAVVMALALLSTPFGWLGLVDREKYIVGVFKALLAFSSASLFAYVAHNALRLRNYLPADREEWSNSLRDWRWWLWLTSRLVGIYDLATGTAAVLWLGCMLWYVWPFRYFFYYRHAACSGGSAAQQVGVDVFLVNMTAHSALLGLCCFLLYLVVIIPPLPSTDINSVPSAYNNVLMRLWTRLQARAEKSSFVSVLSLFSAANSVLALLRVLWFVTLTSPCGFYAACVSWMFVHAHIGMTLFTLPVVNTIMQRCAVVELYRKPFVQKFAEEGVKLQQQQQQQQSNSQTPAAAPESVCDAAREEYEGVATELFNNALVVAALYMVFVHPHVEKPAPAPGSEKKEEPETKLYDVFQAMLQTEVFAHQQQHQHTEEGDGTEEGQDAAEGERVDLDKEMNNEMDPSTADEIDD